MKKNFIIIIAIIALLFSFTACKDKTDTVENAFIFIEAIEKAKTVIKTDTSFSNQEVELTAENIENYLPIEEDSNGDYYCPLLADLENISFTETPTVNGTYIEKAFSNIKDNTGTASRKISFDITYKYLDSENKEAEGKITASAEFVYTNTVERGQTTYKRTETREYKGININGTAYEDLLMRETQNSTSSSYNGQTYATIGGKEVSYSLLQYVNYR